jgi:hypothetical protein
MGEKDGMTLNIAAHTCGKCGKSFPKKNGNFYKSHSLLHSGTGYIPVCVDCVNEIYAAFLNECQDPQEAMRRTCRKLDLYWRSSLFNPGAPGATPYLALAAYLNRANMPKHAGKSYDDTLREECAAAHETNDLDGAEAEKIPKRFIEFWGKGFQRDFYEELEQRYKGWTAGLDKPSPPERAIYKQICLLEAAINRDTLANKSIDKHVNALNTLLGSANLKPAQQKSEDAASAADRQPFGVMIKVRENSRPIPEPSPEFRDVDGIVRYITVWFLGHLCKMLGIRNSYCKLYEEEMARRRVEKPEYESEDDEGLFNDIFGSDESDRGYVGLDGKTSNGGGMDDG